jgi:hypothetical protein
MIPYLLPQGFHLTAKPIYLVAVVLMWPHAHETTTTSNCAHHNYHEQKTDQQPDYGENPPKTPHRCHPRSWSPHDSFLLLAKLLSNIGADATTWFMVHHADSISQF